MSVRAVPNPRAGAIQKEIARLLKMRLLVGIPGDAANEPGSKAPLWLIGYVQEFGDDAKNIPARPFLMPGVDSVRPEIVNQLGFGAATVLAGGPASVAEGHLSAAGLVAVSAVKKRMQDGPFVPLSPRTIAARARRRDKDTGKLVNTSSTRGARQFIKLQAEGVPTDVLTDAGLAKPLIDKGDLIRNIQSVVDKG